jgi:hypothetical protein
MFDSLMKKMMPGLFLFLNLLDDDPSEEGSKYEQFDRYKRPPNIQIA